MLNPKDWNETVQLIFIMIYWIFIIPMIVVDEIRKQLDSRNKSEWEKIDKGRMVRRQ